MSAAPSWPVFQSKLVRRQTVAERTMAFQFEKPSGWTFKAGQFLDMTLLSPPQTDAEGWAGDTGMIDQALLSRHSKDATGMVKGLHAMLKGAGMDDDDVRTEEFIGY